MSPPLWHPPIAIVLYYVYIKTENFCTDNPVASYAPPPPWGAGLAQGASMKAIIRSVKCDYSLFFSSGDSTRILRVKDKELNGEKIAKERESSGF
jgi:hypothetical protein